MPGPDLGIPPFRSIQAHNPMSAGHQRLSLLKNLFDRNLFAGNVARPGYLPGQGRIATHSLRRFSRSDYRLLAGGVLDDGRGTGPPNPLGVPMPVVVRAGW